MMRFPVILCLAVAVGATAQTRAKSAPSTSAAKPRIEDVRAWMDKAEQQLLNVEVESGRADWIAATYIIDDSEVLSAQANQKAIGTTVDLVKESAKFDGIPLPEDLERKM